MKENRFAEAEGVLIMQRSKLEESLGLEDISTLMVSLLILDCSIRQGNPKGAVELGCTLYATLKRVAGDLHPVTCGAGLRLCKALGLQGKRDEAVQLLRPHLKVLMAGLGAEHPQTVKMAEMMGVLKRCDVW